MKTFSFGKLFVILALCFIAFMFALPYIKDNGAQIKRISYLRKFNKRAVFVYKVFYSQKKDDFVKVCASPTSDLAFLNEAKSYLRGNSVDLSKHKYSYRYLNRTPVSEDSEFYFDNFVKTQSGAYVGTKINCHNKNNEVLFFFDFNGEKEPNRIGKDIFFFKTSKDGFYPYGYDKVDASIKDSCSGFSTGTMCSMFYISGSRTQE